MTLTEVRDLIRVAPLTIDRTSAEYAAINQACADLKVTDHQIPLLRSALQRYAEEAFYDDVAPTSSAGTDRGEHARWVLRLTDPNPV